MKRDIYCYYAPIKSHQRPRHYPLFFPIFLQILFLTFTFFFNIYPYYNISPSLTFSSPHYLYFNVIVHLSLRLPLFCIILFTLFYYKFVIISSILYIIFPHKNVISISLSLSLSHTIFWWIFLFFLHLCFRLINFCVFKNSNLGLWDLTSFFFFYC